MFKKKDRQQAKKKEKKRKRGWLKKLLISCVHALFFQMHIIFSKSD